MYRYHQVKEKGTWKPLSDSPGYGLNSKVYQEAVRVGATKLTILAVSEVVDEFTNKDLLSYKGPLYFDIDCKEDIYQAIKSARELVQKLLEMKVDPAGLLVYCSGSKGLHVIVDEQTFSSGRAVKGLPRVYKEMARALFVFGLDYQVYSGGRGTSWRLANIQREDGKYRVSLSLDELEVLTPEIYQEYVSAPRTELSFPDKIKVTQSPALATLFERCKQTVQRLTKQRKTKVSVGLAEEVLEEIKATEPQCIVDLCSGKLRESVKFNEAALQLATYLASVKASKLVASRLCGQLAETTNSSTYATARERLQHAEGLVGYCQHSGSAYQFSCGALKKVITTNPCSGCPIEGTKTTAQKAAEDGDSGILEKEDGYYIIGPEHERRISTFTLQILDCHVEPQQDGSIERRTGFKALVKSKGLNCTDSAELFLSEEMWQSKASIIRELSGLGSIAFLGNDMDVQRLRTYVTSQASGEETGKITAVFTAGIVPQQVGSHTVMVYVEANDSINQFKVRGTHHLNADILCPPSVLTCPMPQKGDPKLKEAVEALMRMNSPINMGLMIGWHVAAHFKSHLVEKYNQFPLLSIWGPAGVGKTHTAVQLCFLNGSNHTAQHAPMNVAEANEWPMVDYCTSTTTIPRILDEANESQMKSKYPKLIELLKSAWGNQGVTRGTIRRSGSMAKGRTGARTINIPVSAPLIVLSEQAIMKPAVQHRSVQVFLTMAARHSQQCYDAFGTVTKLRPKLMELGKGLMIQALTSDIEEISSRVEEILPSIPFEYDDRPRYSFAVVLAGLRMFAEICEELELGVKEEVDRLYNSVASHIKGQVHVMAMEKSRTEIDLILQDMALMAQLTQTGMSKDLVEGVQYAMHQGNLLLDHRTAFPLYLNYCAKIRKTPVIRDARQFVALIKQEPYFIEEARLVGFNRPALVLSGARLTEKGIDLSMFNNDVEFS